MLLLVHSRSVHFFSKFSLFRWRYLLSLLRYYTACTIITLGGSDTREVGMNTVRNDLFVFILKTKSYA